MLVTDLSQSVQNGRVRASAQVDWEDCDRPSRRISFETDERFGADLDVDPNAYLLATFAPGFYHGEGAGSLGAARRLVPAASLVRSFAQRAREGVVVPAPAKAQSDAILELLSG